MVLLESDPDIMKFTPSRVPQTREQTLARLQSSVSRETSYGSLGVWAVELKDSKDFVGWFMLLKTERAFPELGFMIVKRLWGKGLATEVGQLLIEYGLGELGFSGINAITDVDNHASIRVLEKLGFRYLETTRKQDKVRGIETEARVFELRKG